MLTLSVQKEVKSWDAAKEKLGLKQFNRALSRSLNESIMQGRTVARSSVKSLYNIPQRYLQGINIDKSTSISLTAKLFASSVPIPMDAFAPKFQTAAKSFRITKKGEQKTNVFKRLKSNPATGVSIEVIKGKREFIPFAFMIDGGAARVFARGEYKGGMAYGFVQRHQRINSSGSDTPIKPLLSITVHAAVINNKSLQKIEERVYSVWPKAFDRNVSFMLSGGGT